MNIRLPYWITGIAWILIFIYLGYNNINYLSGRPNTYFGGVEAMILVMGGVGLVFSVFQFKYGLLGVGILMLVFAVCGGLATIITSVNLEYMVQYLKGLSFLAHTSLPNFVVLFDKES